MSIEEIKEDGNVLLPLPQPLAIQFSLEKVQGLHLSKFVR